MTVYSRRTVLRAGVLSAVAVSSSASRAGPADAARPQTLLLDRSRFSPHVGRMFTIVSGGIQVPARLAAVNDLMPVLRRADPARFSLLFKLAAPLPGGQGIYQLRRRSLSSTDLFVVPVDRGVTGHFCQVIVNRRTAGPDNHRRST